MSNNVIPCTGNPPFLNTGTGTEHICTTW